MFQDIPKEVYTLMGTVVGGLLGFFGTYLTQRKQARLERIKVRDTRIGQVATDLAAVAHATCWVTWSAVHDYVDKKLINDYNAEIHQILPRIIGSHIALAAVNAELGNVTRELVLFAHEVDEKIGQAGIMYETNPKAAVKRLAEINVDARKLDDEIFTRLAEVARDTERSQFLRRIATFRSLRVFPRPSQETT